MKKMFELFRNRMEVLSKKLNENRYIQIIMGGFMGVAALTIGASFFTMIRSLPLGDWYTEWLKNIGLYDLLNLPLVVISNMISLYLIITIGYSTAKSFGKKPINGALISLGSFLMLTPFETTGTFTTEAGEKITQTISNVIPTSAFGASGIFLAIFVGILATRLYVFLDNHSFKIKVPDSVPENVSNMFGTMIPSSAVFVVFLIIRTLCSLTTYGTAQSLIYGIIQSPLVNIGGGYWGAFLYVFLSTLVWLIGMHPSIVYVAIAPLIQTMWIENMTAFAAGTAAPHPEWMAMLYWCTIGGTGCTMGLSILMAFRAKSKHLKTLGKLSVPTSLFAINEPILFGLPIILNLKLAIPFLLAPTVNFFLTSLVNSFGFAKITGAMLSGVYPVIVQGAFTTGSWEGAVWQLALLIIDTIIYYPFFMRYDKTELANETETVEGEDDLI